MMAFLSLLAATFCFLVGALTPVFNWSLGEFSPLYWGLFFFALSFLLPGVDTFRAAFRRGP